MKKLCLDRKYTLDQLADEISSAKYYVPEGKEFEEGEWIDLTKEQRLPPHSMGIKEMDDCFPRTGHDSQLERLRWAGLKPKRVRKKNEKNQCSHTCTKIKKFRILKFLKLKRLEQSGIKKNKIGIFLSLMRSKR